MFRIINITMAVAMLLVVAIAMLTDQRQVAEVYTKVISLTNPICATIVLLAMLAVAVMPFLGSVLAQSRMFT